MSEYQPGAVTLGHQLTEAADKFREDLLYTAPEFCGERWGQFRERLRDIASDCAALSVPADEYPAFRAPTIDAARSVPHDSGRDPSAAPEQARDRTGADPLRSLAAEWRRLGEEDGGTPFRDGYRAALRKCADELGYELGDREPLVMPQDEFGLVKWLQDALAEAIGPAWGPAAVGRALEAVTPVVEHAARAAAGSHEGIRLWMLDCNALAAKYWDQLQRAEAKLAALAEHRNAACAALRVAETQARYPAGDEATAERYRAAREALEGAGLTREPQERTDEKGPTS